MYVLYFRHVQDRHRLGGVRGVPGAHVVERCRRGVECDVYGVSSERHVRGGEPGGGVLLLRGGVCAGERHDVVRAVQSG